MLLNLLFICRSILVFGNFFFCVATVGSNVNIVGVSFSGVNEPQPLLLIYTYAHTHFNWFFLFFFSCFAYAMVWVAFYAIFFQSVKMMSVWQCVHVCSPCLSMCELKNSDVFYVPYEIHSHNKMFCFYL